MDSGPFHVMEAPVIKSNIKGAYVALLSRISDFRYYWFGVQRKRRYKVVEGTVSNYTGTLLDFHAKV